MTLRICKVAEKQPPTPGSWLSPSPSIITPGLPLPPSPGHRDAPLPRNPLEVAQAQATPLSMLRLETDTSELKHTAAGTGTCADLWPTVFIQHTPSPTLEHTTNDPLQIAHHHRFPYIPMTPAKTPGPAINPQCTALRTPSESSPSTTR